MVVFAEAQSTEIAWYKYGVVRWTLSRELLHCSKSVLQLIVDKGW